MDGTITPYKVIENRKEAIKYAVETARKDDIIVLAGKGHETYQILNDGTIHFDEREIVREYYDTLQPAVSVTLHPAGSTGGQFRQRDVASKFECQF